MFKKHKRQNQNTPEPVRIRPDHQSQTEGNPEPARGWFAGLRAYVADCVKAGKQGYADGYQKARAAYEATKVEVAASATRVTESAKYRRMHGHSLVATFAGSPALRMAGVALVVGAVWGPLGLIAVGTGAALLVRPTLVPRRAVAGLAWTMAGAEEVDRLLVRAWAAVSAKCKIAAASVMAASAVVCAKIRERMATPVVEVEPAC